MATEEIINKVAQSGIITLDLETYYPTSEIIGLDIKPWLFMEMILKEKEFRQRLKEMDWTVYQGKAVAIYCSNDAIIPRWAYMLLTVYLVPIVSRLYVGTPEAFTMQLLNEAISTLDFPSYAGKKIVIKGCGDREVGAAAYAEITRLLLPYAQSIMYGEPCSTVPVYKKKG